MFGGGSKSRYYLYGSKMITKRTYRLTQNALLFISTLVLAASFYFQYALHLHPCPLCLLQRACVFLLTILCLMGVCLSSLKRARTVTFFQIALALAGLFFATRQLWIQALPPEKTAACMPGLDVLIQYFPWKDVFYALFWGTGECKTITWQWLGLSMPAWSALYFFAIAFTGAALFWQLNRSRGNSA